MSNCDSTFITPKEEISESLLTKPFVIDSSGKALGAEPALNFNDWISDTNDGSVDHQLIDEEVDISDDDNVSFDDKEIRELIEQDLQIKVDEIVVVEDIINLDITKMKTIDILHYQSYLAYYLHSVFIGSEKKNNVISMNSAMSGTMNDLPIDYIIGILNWLSKCTTLLAERINQKLISLPEEEFTERSLPKGTQTLVRSFYNFCERGPMCIGYYSLKREPTCTNQHYVHSILKYDIDSIKNFLESHRQDYQSFLNDINVSLRTILFVINHMYKEINYIDYYSNGESEKLHRHNPMELPPKIKQQIKKTFSRCSNNDNHTDYQKNYRPRTRTGPGFVTQGFQGFADSARTPRGIVAQARTPRGIVAQARTPHGIVAQARTPRGYKKGWTSTNTNSAVVEPPPGFEKIVKSKQSTIKQNKHVKQQKNKETPRTINNHNIFSVLAN